jgi:hypothetical protein
MWIIRFGWGQVQKFVYFAFVMTTNLCRLHEHLQVVGRLEHEVASAEPVIAALHRQRDLASCTSGSDISSLQQIRPIGSLTIAMRTL